MQKNFDEDKWEMNLEAFRMQRSTDEVIKDIGNVKGSQISEEVKLKAKMQCEVNKQRRLKSWEYYRKITVLKK